VAYNGELTQGEIFASTENELKALLKKKGLTLLSYKSVSPKIKAMNKTQRLAFTRELSKLLKAGISLYDALETLEDKYKQDRLRYLLFDLKEKVKQGRNFSRALEEFPNSFDILYISMIKNAEQAGTLQKTLEDLTALLEKQEKLRKQVIGALIYPAFILTFAFCVILSLFIFVIPSLNELFEGKNLHPITKTVLGCSQFFQNHKAGVVYFLILLIGFAISATYNRKVKHFFQKNLIRIPLLKPLFIKVSIVRFCRALSVLMRRGIDYVEAIKLAKQMMKHPVLEAEIEKIHPFIIQGERLSDLLQNSTVFPSLVAKMVSVAEESGDMPSMLEHVVDFYQDEVDRNLLKLTSLLQPILLLFLGGIIGLVILSVLLPLVDVGAFLSE